MKKLISILLAIFLSSAMLVSCAVNSEDNIGEENAEHTQQNTSVATTEVTSDTSLDGLTFYKDASSIDKTLAEEIKAAALEFFDGGSAQLGGTQKYGQLYGYAILNYYGEIEGCHPCVIVVNGVAEVIDWGKRSVEINNYNIVFPSSQLVHFYKDGKFYTVKEAYDQGVLSMDGVIEFAKRTGFEHG